MKFSRIKKPMFRYFLGVLILSGLSLIGFFFSFSVSALKTGTAGGLPPSTTGCTATGTTFCGRFGVSWRYYEGNELPVARTACDAEDTDGYYVLAYEWVKVTNGHVEFLGSQVLDRPNKYVHVSQVTSGQYNFVGPSQVSGTQTWGHVQGIWDNYEGTIKNNGGSSWDDTTWFCGNEDLSPRTGITTADSGISVNGVDGSKTGAAVGSNKTSIAGKAGLGKRKKIVVTVDTSQNNISGRIWHNQYYENEDSNWKVTKKKYNWFTLDVLWDVLPGDLSSVDGANAGEAGYAYSWGIKPFKKSDDNTNIGEADYSISAGQSYCHTMSLEPLRFKFTSDGGVEDEAGKAHTSACISVNHVSKPEEPTDKFKANSSVEVPNASSQLGGYDPGKRTSGWDKAVGLKVSTDNKELTFTLSHNMGFDVEDPNHNIWRKWDTCAYTVGSGENVTCVADWVFVGKTTDLKYELTTQIKEISTDTWSADATTEVAENSKSENGTYKAGIDKNIQNQNELAASNTYTISGMEPGKTYKVCHKIKYTPKSYTTPITEKLIWTGPWSIGPQWIYGAPQANGDSEDSEACIEITRPENPPEGGDPDPYGPKNDGSSEAGVMFAGEQTNIGWKVEAKSVPTRRVVDYAAIGFVVRDDIANANGLNTGMAHQEVLPAYKLDPDKDSPCHYLPQNSLIGFSDTKKCAEFIDDSGNLSTGYNGNGFLESGNKPKTLAFNGDLFSNIAVPDNVGAKYCNSYGYKWGYWWGVVYGDTAENLTDDAVKDEDWHHEANKDYWTNYSPACRTIAKKPNFAIWNGSIFSGGGIVSSTAPRHNDANSDQPTKLNDDGNKTTYGSWAENLAVAGSNISRFASSGAYGVGLPGLVNPNGGGNDWKMAWLTISNDGLKSSGSVLGNSGINYNSSYDTRLSAYLKGSATNDVSNQSATTYSGASGVAGTQILYFNPGGTNGTLTINGNVTLDSAKKENIYELPQVVIYVDGNIAIDPSVTRLDAWLIATGDIDTCKGWQDNATETRSLNRDANATCDNQLQINGPVIANSVKLHRTFGADNLVILTSNKICQK